jgi:hypothetical protein
MLLWDSKWRLNQQRLSSLDRDKLLKIAIASIENVVESGIKIDGTIAYEFRDAFDSVKRGMPYDCDKLEELIQGENGPGVYDLSMAVINLSHNLEAIDKDTVLESLSYCYQAILDREILSELERNMTESDINVLEAGNANCVGCIQKQLDLLEVP